LNNNYPKIVDKQYFNAKKSSRRTVRKNER
jgi:hypothetical protein